MLAKEPCRFPRITYRDQEQAKEAVGEEPRIRRVFCPGCAGWHLVIVAPPVVTAPEVKD